MKHLFLEDDETKLMVYYPPKKKALLYELVFKFEKEYWYLHDTEKEPSESLLWFIYFKLQENGFKVVDITTEEKEAINVYDDLTEDSFTYRGVLVSQSMYGGFSFWVGKTLNTCLTIEEAINTIDKELK